MRDLRAYTPAAVLLVGCALVITTRSQEAVPLAAPLSGVLADYGTYTFADQKISAEERKVAGMSDYVARVYSRDTTVAFTTLVSYYDRQTQGKTIHSPRNCLPGAGWEIVQSGTRTLPVDGRVWTVNRYVLKNGHSSAYAYYWYQGRGRVESNEYRVKWDLLRDAALTGHTEEALVRVVVPILTNAPVGSASARPALAKAERLGDAVSTQMIREVARALPGGLGARQVAAID